VLYRLFFRLVLVRMDAERAHGLGLAALRRTPVPATRVSERLVVEAFGRRHKTPLGVAAGLDKEATAFLKLHRLGFGHVEIGTVTPESQPGNPKPRVFRLAAHRALINRMGFPSPGIAGIESALGRRRAGDIVGLNVGKNKDTAPKHASSDFATVAERLESFADFVIVNVSSPNTPGLRDLQAVEPLREILISVQRVTDKPLLLKISPDLANDDIDEITDLAIELGLAGIVCTNTTISRDKLPPGDYETGGLSGEPLKARSMDVLRLVRARAGDKLVLISVGGVSTADDVWDRLAAGATLVQAYTGFVYGGPLWPRRINRGLAKRLEASDFDSIADVTGSEIDA
jgi:dihydroorotate dehydrogenase